jgi:hypothetical protein
LHPVKEKKRKISEDVRRSKSMSMMKEMPTCTVLGTTEKGRREEGRDIARWATEGADTSSCRSDRSWRAPGGVVNDEDGVVHKIRKTGHEWIPEMLEVSTVAHFFGEYVSRIDLPGNVLDMKSVVLDPLPNRVFAKLDVPRSLWGHVVGPFDACIIVIVKDSRGIDIWESVASFGNTAREIAKVDNLFQSGAGSAYFGLAGTQGRTILTFSEPPDGNPVL